MGTERFAQSMLKSDRKDSDFLDNFSTEKFIVMEKQLMQYSWLIALSITSGVAGQTMIKLGVTRPGAVSSTDNLVGLVLMIFQSPFILGGLVLYGVGALAWIAVLARMDLSYAYPFLALNFILITVVSRLALGETIPTSRWIGIAVICLGIILIARAGNPD